MDEPSIQGEGGELVERFLWTIQGASLAGLALLTLVWLGRPPPHDPDLPDEAFIATVRHRLGELVADGVDEAFLIPSLIGSWTATSLT